jgi:uncharacterized protein YraI
MRFLTNYSKLFLLLAAVLVLAACGGKDEEPTPTPTKTPTTVAQAPALATNTPAPAAQPAAPQPTATPVPQAVPVRATVNADELNVRSGPGASYDVVQTLTNGQQFDVIAVSSDGGWLELADNGQSIGWAAAEFLAVQGDLSSLSTVETVAQAGGNDPASTAGSGNYLPPTMTSPDFGAQAFLWWRPEVADRDLTLMKEADFRWVKQAFAWETIEGSGKGQFDWSTADRVVQQVNDHGLKLLARLSSDPELTNFWAGKPPQNADDFADFAFAVANRYNCTPEAVGCIQAFQVWNEPNLAREWGNNRPNPAQYVEFLGKAYQAIKRGNPNAIVISAGMAPTGDNNDIAMPDDMFYEQMYQNMGGDSDGFFDKLGVHGAGFAAPPELDPAQAAADKKYGGYRFFAFRHVEDIRNIMVRYGDADKQIVLLEFGWTFDSVNPSYKWHGADAGINMFVQADYLKRAYQYAAANWQPWIGLMSLITMPNLDWLNDGNPKDEEQYWWAIMEPSPVNELHFRPAFVELCIYFNQLDGQTCKYDPGQ